MVVELFLLFPLTIRDVSFMLGRFDMHRSAGPLSAYCECSCDPLLHDRRPLPMFVFLGFCACMVARPLAGLQQSVQLFGER